MKLPTAVSVALVTLSALLQPAWAQDQDIAMYRLHADHAVSFTGPGDPDLKALKDRAETERAITGLFRLAASDPRLAAFLEIGAPGGDPELLFARYLGLLEWLGGAGVSVEALASLAFEMVSGEEAVFALEVSIGPCTLMKPVRIETLFGDAGIGLPADIAETARTTAFPDSTERALVEYARPLTPLVEEDCDGS